MNSPLMELDQPSMQAQVNSYIPGTGLAWGVLFPLKYTSKFDLKGIEGNEGIPVTADRVAFNTKAPLKTRKTVGTWSGRIGKIAVSRGKDEIEINEYEDAKIVAAANPNDTAAAKELVEMVYNDIDFCNKAMDFRVELDALRIASSGKQVYSSDLDGDMQTNDEINFNVPAENFKGASVAWSNASTATGIQDIIDAQEAVAAKGFPKPMFAYMEKAAFTQLRNQEATAKKLYPRTTDLTTVNSEMLKLDDINSWMDQNGYPHIIVLDTYVTVEDKKGNQTTVKPWATNVVTLAPTRQLGWTYHKTVPLTKDTAALQTYGQYYKMTRYSELNPTSEVTLAEGYVQCALINRASTVFMNTAKTSWSNGTK